MKRNLIYKDDKIDKFWSIEVSGTSFTVTYGKMGTEGQTSTKEFETEEACMKEAERLLAENYVIGYKKINWYVLDIDYNLSPFVTISFPSQSPDNDLSFMTGRSNLSVKTPITIIEEEADYEEGYPDFFDGGHGRIISDKLLNVFRETGVKGVQAYPSIIKAGQKIVANEGSYYVMSVTTRLSCIDISRSECIYSGDKVFRVLKMFINEDLIPADIDILIPDEWDQVLLIGEKLFEAVSKNEITGARLLPWPHWTNNDY